MNAHPPDPVKAIREVWEREREKLVQTPFFTRLAAGQLSLDHYQAFLRETYYNTRENPHTYALFAGHLRGKQRDLLRRVLRHAASEYGHHLLALEDLRRMGVDVSGIPEGRPLPATEAFTAFSVYQVQHRNPLSYLGYVYHLEMLPARGGGTYAKLLRAMGVPESAMTFVREHIEADQGHTRLMEENFRRAAETPEDLEALLYGVTGACRLHGVMLQGLVDQVDAQSDWGMGAARLSVAKAFEPEAEAGHEPKARVPGAAAGRATKDRDPGAQTAAGRMDGNRPDGPAGGAAAENASRNPSFPAGGRGPREDAGSGSPQAHDGPNHSITLPWD